MHQAGSFYVKARTLNGDEKCMLIYNRNYHNLITTIGKFSTFLS